MSDAFLTMDRDFRFTSLNPRAQDLYFGLTGETVEAFIGQVVWEKFPGSEESVFGESYKRAIYEQIPVTAEALVPPVNRWLRCVSIPSRVVYQSIFRILLRGNRRKKPWNNMPAI
jgi:hypothetical protein